MKDFDTRRAYWYEDSCVTGIPMNLPELLHFNGMPYRCKSSDKNYLSGCNISISCITAIATNMSTF